MRKILLLIFELFFRKKTLTYIIWVIIIAIIGELHAINNNAELIQILDKVIKENENFNIEIFCLAIKFIIGSGSVLTLIVLICLFIVIAYLKYLEIKPKPQQEKTIDKNAKNELIYTAIANIQKSQILDNNTYIALKSIVGENALSKKLDYYYSFERKRGNIYLLEEYVNSNNIINELLKLISNEI